MDTTRRVDQIPGNVKHQQDLAFKVLTEATETGRELPKVQTSPPVVLALKSAEERAGLEVGETFNQGKIGSAEDTPVKDNTILYAGLGLGALLLLSSSGGKKTGSNNILLLGGAAVAAYWWYQNKIKSTL